MGNEIDCWGHHWGKESILAMFWHRLGPRSAPREYHSGGLRGIEAIIEQYANPDTAPVIRTYSDDTGRIFECTENGPKSPEKHCPRHKDVLGKGCVVIDGNLALTQGVCHGCGLAYEDIPEIKPRIY